MAQEGLYLPLGSVSALACICCLHYRNVFDMGYLGYGESTVFPKTLSLLSSLQTHHRVIASLLVIYGFTMVMVVRNSKLKKIDTIY